MLGTASTCILLSAVLLPGTTGFSHSPSRCSGFAVSFCCKLPLQRHAQQLQNSRKCPARPTLSRISRGRGRVGALRLQSSGMTTSYEQDQSQEEDYELVEGSNYTTIRAVRYGEEEINETFHPGVGPEVEGRLLYVQQLQLVEREKEARHLREEFVLWDVGLGAAGNAICAIQALAASGCPRLRVVSFDRTAGAARFALQHSEKLTYMQGMEGVVGELISAGRAETVIGETHLVWDYHQGDFPELIRKAAARLGNNETQDVSERASEGDGVVLPCADDGVVLPCADGIMYDAFSPAKCASMWTLPLFQQVLALQAPARACLLSTSSRSTIVRATLLLAGFFVGVGGQTGGTARSIKEETTVAASLPGELAWPLGGGWLGRVGRSSAAEPLYSPTYVRAPVSPATMAALQSHPQFNPAPHAPTDPGPDS